MRSDLVPNLLQATVRTTIYIDFPLGSFSDTGKRILSIEPIFLRLGTTSTSTRITIENTDTYDARIETLWSREYPVNGSEVFISLTIEGTNYTVFRGIVTGISAWTRESVTFECADRSTLYSGLIGTVITTTDDTSDGYYPNAPTESVGKIIPWVWGTIVKYAPLLVDDDVVTELTQAVTTADTEIYVASTENFPDPPAYIYINDEKIQYVQKYSTYFAGCFRGQGDTVPGSHVKGNQVIESGNLVYLVANHDIDSGNITNVRYVSSDDIEVPIDSGDYTITYTKPAKITFTEAPTLLVPQTTHKLKLIDFDAYTHNLSSNPTYCLGAHADWTEYNYTTFDAQNEWVRPYRSIAVVEPTGELIRAWLVVEYAETTVGSLRVGAFYGSYPGEWHYLGYTPEKTDTPDTIKEDQTIHMMSAGFEDAHTHEFTEPHAHLLNGAGTYNITPSIDSGNLTDYSTWGVAADGYNGDWDTYAEFTLNGTTHLGQMYLIFANTSEDMGVTRKIKRIHPRIMVGRSTGSSSGAKVVLNFHMENTVSGIAYDVDLNPSGVQQNQLKTDEGTMFDVGWLDVSDEELYSCDWPNAYFRLGSLPTYDYHLYNAEVDVEIDYDADLSMGGYEFGSDEIFTYVPAYTCSVSGYDDTYDLDWATHATVYLTNNPTYTFLNPATPSTRQIIAIMPIISGDNPGGDGTYDWFFSFRVWNGGNPYTVSGNIEGPDTNTQINWPKCFGSSQGNGIYDVSGLGMIASDLNAPETYIQRIYSGSSSPRVIEVGLYVLFEDSQSGLTGYSAGGPSDEQEGEYSHLAWFDLDDMTSWQWPYNGGVSGAPVAFEVREMNADDTAKILRAMVVGEFAPREKKVVKQIACDVVGRDDTFDSIITDVLTESDLMGAPSEYVSIPALTAIGAGALTDQTEGWSVISQLLNEARCHGYWSWEGIYTVRLRPKRSDLTSNGAIDTAFNVSKSVQDLDELVNKIRYYYSYDFIKQTMAADAVIANTESQTKYNKTTEQTLDLQFIRDATEAESIAETVLSYLEECFEGYDVEVFINGLNYEPGDTPAITADGHNAPIVEVKEARVLGLLDDDLKIQIKGVRYDS